MQTDLGQSNTASPGGSVDPTSPTQPTRKRKATSTGSRGVATLTPDQLAKKRANDREAQRAIRERTKQTINELENRIQELTAQQPYQELQTVIGEKDAIQAENVEIRRKLSSILALIQPIVGAQGLTGTQYKQLPLTYTEFVSDLASAAHHNAQASVPQSNNVFHPDSCVHGQQRPYGPAPPAQGESAYPSFPEPGSEQNPAWHASKDALEQQRENLGRGLEIGENGERLSFNFLLENITGQKPPHPAPILHPQHKSPTQPSAYYSFTNSPAEDQRPWNTLPKHCEPTCPLDNILLNLYQKARQDRSPNSASSQPTQNVPAQPSVMSLLNPSQRVDTLSQTMADITTRFPHIHTIPNRVAVVWLQFVTARWFLYPTQENYERMPEWMHPTSAQLLVPHPAWIDYIPWPLMRDKVVLDWKQYTFDNWFIPFTVGLSVNWPYGPMDCLLSMPGNEDLVINPVFEKHILRHENWSVSPLLMDTFPALKGTATVKEQPENRDSGGEGR